MLAVSVYFSNIVYACLLVYMLFCPGPKYFRDLLWAGKYNSSAFPSSNTVPDFNISKNKIFLNDLN